jgi:hypothetical protein
VRLELEVNDVVYSEPRRGERGDGVVRVLSALRGALCEETVAL